MFRSFGNPTKVALITFFSSLYFYLPILTIYYQTKGLSFVQINSLWGIIVGTIFLAEIPTGVLADKVGRKFSIILAMFFQLIAEVFFLFAQNYYHFIFISILAGIGFAFQSGCQQALVYDSLKEQKKEKEIKKTMGTIISFSQLGQIIGALVSSIIISQLTRSRMVLTIVMTIVSLAIALFLSFFLKDPQKEYKHTEKSPFTIISESFQLIKGNPALKRVVLLGIFTTPFIGYLVNFQPPYFLKSNVPSIWLGLSLSIGGIIAAVSSRYAYKLEKFLGINKAAFLATTIPALMYILMAFIVHPLFAVLLFSLNYGLMSLQDPLLADYYNIHIKSDIRATTLSTINMFSSIYIALMGLVIGKIADVSLISAFLFMGVIIFIGAMIFRINESHIISRNIY